MHENVIEWFDGDDTISVTLHQKKFINKVKKLSEDMANEVAILAENDDGSIFAHLPISSLNLRPKTSRVMSEENKLKFVERMRKSREEHE